MAILRSIYVCSCSLVIVAAMLSARAAAEAVQTSLSIDANTTALYLFKEGTGTSSACEEAGVPAAVFKGAPNWVPGRQYFAVATDSGYMTIEDNEALRPVTAITVEAWVKLAHPGGDLLVKEGAYFFRVGETITANFAVGGSGWTAVKGKLPVPAGQWTHLAITFDSATHMASIYINGVLDTATKCREGTMNPSKSTLWLGRNDYAASSGVDGKIDSLRISNIARQFTPLPPLSVAAPAPKGNLIPNGDFEIGLNGWREDNYGDTNLIWETTGGAKSGQKCLHSLAGANPKAGLLSRPIPNQPDRHYTLSGWFKQGAKCSPPRIRILAVGNASGDVSDSTTSFSPAIESTWKHFSTSFRLPASYARSPSLAVHLSYPSSGDYYADDLRLMATEDGSALALKDKITVGPQSLPVGGLYIYTPGATTATTLTISNTDTVAHEVTVQPTITDWEEKQVSGVPSLGKVSVPANKAITVNYGMDTARRGSFRLGFDLTSGGQTWHQSAEVKYAVVVNMQNVGDPDSSCFAMNTHMEREPTPHLVREMQVLSKCGVKWVRAWWGWGMCENPQGTYNWTEYDRQFDAVTNGTGLRIMPILLRLFTLENTNVGSFAEWPWAGPVTNSKWSKPNNPMQQPPFDSMMDQWGIFCGKVAQRYAGRIKAYELWNEPGMDDAGTVTTDVYTKLLKETRSNICKAGNDPNAKVVAFSGTANLKGAPPRTRVSVAAVLANDTASEMDVVSEHTYGQLMMPEKSFPLEVSALRAVMTAGGCPTNMPIWDTEQGIHADGDGYKEKYISETDVAQLYTRDVISAVAAGCQRFFWFSADNTPEYGFTVFFGDYVPRPRLAALNACASFIEGTTFQKTFNPDSNTFAHLFQGPNTGVCVFWNRVVPMQLTLPMDPTTVQAFDTMGNAIPITGTNTSTIQVAAERPTFLQCSSANYNALSTALSTATVTPVPTVNIVTTATAGGVVVTLTGASPTAVDGIVDLLPAASTTPEGWPPAQHFQGLAQGQSQSFTFVLPAKAAVGQVRVRSGDRCMTTTSAPYMAP